MLFRSLVPVSVCGPDQAGAITNRVSAVLANLPTGGTQAAFRTRQPLVQTVTTNVPGPRAPLYVLGRRLTALYPYVPIGNAVRLSVAILSYVDTISFGVTADAGCAADLDVFTAGIQRGLAELSG